MATNIELQMIAQRLAELYVEVRRLSQPNYVMRNSSATQEVFLKAAQMCADKNLTPEDFVTQQFRNKPEHTEFYPNMLLNKHTRLQETPECTQSIKEFEPDIIFNVQAEYLKAQVIALKRNALEVLLDDTIDLYPWFRVLITDEPVPQVIEKYRDKARASLFPQLVAFLTKKGFDLTRISK